MVDGGWWAWCNLTSIFLQQAKEANYELFFTHHTTPQGPTRIGRIKSLLADL
jgi:hypothetical protein